jgi:hypothetical protein
VAKTIQDYFYLDEPKPAIAGAEGSPGNAVPGLQNLIVMRDRTPVKVRPDIAGQTAAVMDAGARLVPENMERGGAVNNWWRVRVDSTTVGWVHEQFVSEPVRPATSEERFLRAQAVRNAKEQDKLSRAEQAKREAERDELEKKINPHWPYEIRNAIRNHRLVTGMNQEMVKLSIGFPDDIIWTSTTEGTNEEWIFKAVGKPYKSVHFEKDAVTGWKN